MNRFLQISCFAITFVTALYVGIFFAFLISSEQFTLQQYLPGKPLPGVLLFFIKNPGTLYYLFLYPWLGFIGFPLISSKISYWDTDRFLLRFSVFLPLEILLIVFTATACIWPFIGILAGMSDSVPPLTLTEESTRDVFWLLVAAAVVGVCVRAGKPRR